MKADETIRRVEAVVGWWPGRTMLVLAMWAVASISCQKQAAEEPVGDVVTTSPAPAPEPYTPAMMDSKDDPESPRTLPRSNEVQGWIKTKPIKVATGQKIPVLVADQEMDRVMSGYRVLRVAMCEYTSANATARALLIETSTSADAFGVFCMQETHPGCTLEADNSLRGRRQEGDLLVLTAWQGKTWLRLTCKLQNEEAGIKDCERLMSRAVFSMVADEPPLLMRAVQDVKMEHCDLWLVRSARMLTLLSQPTLRLIDPGAVNKRLGLGGPTGVTLSVVVIQQTADVAPIVLWLAEYFTPDDAKAAEERYTKALQESKSGLDAQTLVGPARGRVVIGTWNADQETARNLIKLLGQALPD